MKNSYRIIKNTVVIEAKYKDQIYEIIIDKDDFERASSRTWQARKVHGKMYARAKFNGKFVSLHRFIFGNVDSPIDHINHNGLDNRKANLRAVSVSENAQNRSPSSILTASGVRNVTWKKSVGKWQVSVKVMGKNIYCGIYSDIREAEQVAIEARKKYLPCSTW